MSVKIIADCMGGDNAPQAMVEGAILARKDFGVDITLVGDESKIKPFLGNESFEIVHTPVVMETCDSPKLVMKEKADSSMAVALKLLADGKGDAVVSTGSTGGLLVGASLYVKRIKGIRRAALAPVLPSKDGGVLLIDSGANIECSPEYLVQFAMMGDKYAKKCMNRPNPRVGLLNIGAEETKGDELHRETWKQLDELKKAGEMNFVGNIEPRDVMYGACDVLVADGFSGNVMLKGAEGAVLYTTGLMKQMLMKNLGSKLAALMLKKGIGEMKRQLDYREIGGAPMLGISRPVIKSHGSANAYTFRSAIGQAVTYIKSGMIEELSKQ